VFFVTVVFFTMKCSRPTLLFRSNRVATLPAIGLVARCAWTGFCFFGSGLRCFQHKAGATYSSGTAMADRFFGLNKTV